MPWFTSTAPIKPRDAPTSQAANAILIAYGHSYATRVRHFKYESPETMKITALS